MAGIKIVITDVLTKISTTTVTNGDGSVVSPHVRVWNNQLKSEEGREIYSFPKPAFFVEIATPVAFEVIGQGFRSADINIKVHIIHEFYNADDGTFEQDLVIFDLRDQVIQLLTYFTPSGCGPLTCISEEMDYDHNNLYHLVLDFVCNFTDSKGSRYDPQSNNGYIASIPPTDLEVQATVEQGGEPIKRQFIINT